MLMPLDEDFPNTDPGNQLRRLLNVADQVRPEEPPINVEALADILYTAEERNLTEFRIDRATAILIWRLVELSRRIDPAILATVKM